MATILKSDSKGQPLTRPNLTDLTESESTTGRAGVSTRLSGDVIGKHGGGTTGLTEFNLSDLAEKGREELRQARRQVEAMMAEATVEAAKRKADAESQGYEDGIRRASEDIEKKIQQLAEAKTKSQLQSLHDASTQMHATFDQWMKQYADTMTETALAAAERLVRANLSEMPVPTSLRDAGFDDSPDQQHLMIRWASEALHSTRSAGRLVVAVHPDLLAELGQRFDELLASPDLPEQSCVIGDESLPIGEVVVRQEGGEIRAGLQAQLERLREELL